MEYNLLDIAVLGSGILFFLLAKKYIGPVLRKLLFWSIIFVLGVSLYGLASSLSQLVLDKADNLETEFFQSFMDEGSQTWLKKYGETND